MGRIINKTTRRYKGIPPGEIQKKHELKAIVIPPKSIVKTSTN